VEAPSDRTSEERQLALLVSSVRDYAIFMLDPVGRILSWNVGAERLKGYTREEIVGRHFSIFYTADDKARHHPDEKLAIARHDGSYEEEGWRVRKDGSTFWANVVITAVRDESGELTGFAKVTRDLTARKQADEALRAAVEDLSIANAELDRFAALAAHDLTDPLRTISGFAELLARSDLSDEQREYAQHIQGSATRLNRTLGALLTYARAGKSVDPRESVDLSNAVAHVLADLAGPIRERDAHVTVDVPAGAAIEAAPADVRLLLQNLVANGVKFADDERPEVRLAAEPAGSASWRVVVEDNGPGVAVADRERIFEAFERTATGIRRGGYGLGLAICRRLAERYGGDVGVESAPRGGSRFWFTLPAATGERRGRVRPISTVERAGL
jgi:PAS domain S-box-containing protein